MTSSPFAPTIGNQAVTASELVRHFGIWQERAARDPVYILHRGRPRLVLTSVELMDALCSPHAVAPQDDEGTVGALLDADDGTLLVLDLNGTVRIASLGARRRFGDHVSPGRSIADLAATAGDLLIDAVGRVGRSGTAETVEITTWRYPERVKHCRISPFPKGCVVSIEDMSLAQESILLRRRHRAMQEAVAASGAIAFAVSPRGYIVDPPAELGAQTGVAMETLSAARFTSLFDVGDRIKIGDAIERVFGERMTLSLDAWILVRGASRRSATVGFAPIVERHQADSAAVTIVIHRTNA